MTCYKHPTVETFLRCGKCDRPICLDCVVVGPAGTRCRECGATRTSPLFQVPADRLALGVAGGLAVGTAAGLVIAAAYRLGFFGFWLGILGGWAVAETILRITGRRRGPRIEAAAGICAALGVGVGLALWFLAGGFPPTVPAVLGFLQRHPFQVLAMAAAVFFAVSRARHL